MDKKPLIGLLITGDELINGDIQDGNGQPMAQALVEQGFDIGQHIWVGDDLSDLKDAFAFLLKKHHVIITTGGLGPTSDDKTRFAVSEIINQSLVFNQDSWQRITSRIAQLSYPLHDSNRQQALFPEGATVLPNENGTADGCKIYFDKKLIFLLPGPPAECLPIFNQQVLPEILQHVKKTPVIHKKWRLFGVSESEIAATIDAALQDIDCTTGYRTDYPYIELKIHTEKDSEELMKTILPVIQPHLLGDGLLPASRVLRKKLTELTQTLYVHDRATGGLLQTQLLRPYNCKALVFGPFDPTQKQTLALEITGLNEIWQGKAIPCETHIQLNFYYNDQMKKEREPLIFRHKKTTSAVVERICQHIIEFLDELPPACKKVLQ